MYSSDGTAEPGYADLLPHVHRTLEVLFECDAQESVTAVTRYVLHFSYEDGSTILQWRPPEHPDIVLRGRIMEAVCSWVGTKMKSVDDLIPMLTETAQNTAQSAKLLRVQLEQATYNSNHEPQQVIVEFLNMLVIDLLGREAAVLGSVLAGTLVSQEERESIYAMVEQPSLLLAWLVRALAEIESKVARVALAVYESTIMTRDDAKKALFRFFQHFTVETGTGQGTLEVHDTWTDEDFKSSPFSVKLIDSYGNLMKLLQHLENLSAVDRVTIAVDFEGVKLCRHGALCLVQITVNDDPRLVYVLDVHVLSERAFTLTTPGGTSLKGVLENPYVRKVWFDPRNDVDALYHQFHIQPFGIFDLQLAEVAARRRRGLPVAYLQGLHKCLNNCPGLLKGQQDFASTINSMGKQLFEPQNGGSYEIFQQRPLNPIILVYAAHDSRYMLELYEHFLNSLETGWVQRVEAAGNQRARWCESREYVLPSSDAPDF